MSVGAHLAVLAVALSTLACGRSAKSHCEARQAFWERAFAKEEPDLANRSRTLFVESCTRELSKPGAGDELRCRDRCLEAAPRFEPEGSRSAQDAYSAFTRCEAACLGAKAAPQPVE